MNKIYFFLIHKRKIKKALLILIPFLYSAHSRIIFPVENYPQDITLYIDPTDSDYDKPIISSEYQKLRFKDFFDRYYSSGDSDKSPWCKEFVEKELRNVFIGGNDHQNYYLNKLYNYKNQLGLSKEKNEYNILYGINYKPYSHDWYDAIAITMNFDSNETFSFSLDNLGIAVDNSLMRIFPTDDPCFLYDEIPGEGFPFDNLQQSALNIGQSVYIVKESLDHAWTLVLSVDCFGWVKSNSIARVNRNFIKKWQTKAKKNIIGILKQSPLINKYGTYRALALTGNTLPLKKKNDSTYTVLIPIKKSNGFAEIECVSLDKSYAIVMPYLFTPHHLANILKNQIGRPYGWGNQNFYFDCSAELKAIFATFGIYLPRNSASQVNADFAVDILDNLSSSDRENFLLENGRKFVTICYVPGHVFLYLGKFTNTNSPNKETVAVTYQNIWGFRTSKNDSRFIVGQSAILPMLSKYPEIEDLIPLQNTTRYKKFRLIYLDTFRPKDK